MNKVLVSIALLCMVIPLVGSEAKSQADDDCALVASRFCKAGNTEIQKKENNHTTTFTLSLNCTKAILQQPHNPDKSHELTLHDGTRSITFVLTMTPINTEHEGQECDLYKPTVLRATQLGRDKTCTVVIFQEWNPFSSGVTFIVGNEIFDALQAQYEGQVRDSLH